MRQMVSQSLAPRLRALLDSPGASAALVRGASGSLGVRVLGVVIGLGAHLVLTRICGVEAYGTYIYAFTILQLMLLPATLGFTTALVRFVAAYRGADRRAALRGLLRRSHSLVLLSSTLVGAVAAGGILLAGDSMPAALRSALLVACVALPILATTALMQAATRGLKRVARSQVPEQVVRPTALAILAGALFLATGRSLSGGAVMAVLVVAGAVSLVVAWRIQRPLLVEAARSESVEYHTGTWLRTSIPLMLIAGVFLLMRRMDAVMIGLLRGSAEVGIYSVAARISNLVLFGFAAIGSIAAPMIAEYHASRGRRELQALIHRVTRLTLLSTLPLLLGTVALGRPLLGLFGEQFVSAYVPLLLLSLGMLLSVCAGPAGIVLSMCGHERVNLKIAIFALVLNAALNLPAISAYGIVGAAAVTGGVEALRSLLLWRAARRLVGVDGCAWSALAS